MALRREKKKNKNHQPPPSMPPDPIDCAAQTTPTQNLLDISSDDNDEEVDPYSDIAANMLAVHKALKSGKTEKVCHALLSLSEAQNRQNLIVAKMERNIVLQNAKIIALELQLKQNTGSMKNEQIMADLNENTQALRDAMQAAPALSAASPVTTTWATALGRRSRPSSTLAVAPGSSAFPELLPMAPRPGVLFFPTGEGEKRSEATKELLKKTVSPAQLGIQVTGIRNVRNGGIIVHPRSEDEARRLVNALGTSEAGLRAELAGKKQPRVIFFHVPAITTETQLREAIRRSTQERTGLTEKDYESVRISHKAGPRTGRCHFVAFVPAAVRAALLADDRLFMGWDSFPLQDFSGVVKCNKCHLYGHMAKACTAKEPTCSHCAVQGHDRADCTAKDGPAKCVACLKHRQPNAHPTNAPECPARQHAELRERAMTDYSIQR